MIILKRLDVSKSLPEVFTSEKDFISYSISEATWLASATDEVPVMISWGFKQIIDNLLSDSDETIFHWDATYDTCINFWNTFAEGKWNIEIK